MQAFRVVATPTSTTLRVPGTSMPLVFRSLDAACRVATTLELAADAKVPVGDFFGFERGVVRIDDAMGRFGAGPCVYFGPEFHVRETRATKVLDDAIGIGRYFVYEAPLHDETFG